MILFRQSLGLSDYSSEDENDNGSEDDLFARLPPSDEKKLSKYEEQDEKEETSEDEEDIEEFIRKIEEDADMVEELQDNPIDTYENEIADDILYGDVNVENIDESYGKLPEGEDSELDDNILDEYESYLRETGQYNEDSSDEELGEMDEENIDDDLNNKSKKSIDNDLLEEEEELENDEEEKRFLKHKNTNSKNDVKEDENMGIDENEEDEFERYESELIAQMEQLENDNLKEKSWQEAGEISAKKREKDTLLEEDLKYDHTGKAVPIIDKKSNEDIESIIIHRILENIFDDPIPPEEKKEKEDLKKLQISAEKDRKSLVEIYEKKYLETIHGEAVEEENPEEIKVSERKAEIKNHVSKILQLLNKMSSFHYVAAPTKFLGTDKVQLSDIAKTSSSKEESSGIIRSEALEATATEIMTSLPYLQVGETEMTKEDRKRKRRLAKQTARKKAKTTQDLVDKLNPSKSISSKQQKEVLDSLKKIEADPDAHTLSKSKDFFTKLQENMEKGNKSKKQQAIEDDKGKHTARQRARYDRF